MQKTFAQIVTFRQLDEFFNKSEKIEVFRQFDEKLKWQRKFLQNSLFSTPYRKKYSDMLNMKALVGIRIMSILVIQYVFCDQEE